MAWLKSTTIGVNRSAAQMDSQEAARRASGASQNGMRPIALGRKNWMHLGTQKSGPPVAAIMSVLTSAQRAGVNLRLYLSHCLEKLADRSFTTDQIHTLLPENWKPPTA
jgi:transposase